MTLQGINRGMTAVLLITATALVCVVLWGLSQLQTTYQLARDYYAFRETLSGEWRSQIEDYLHGGDGVKLDAALRQLDAIGAQSLPQLPPALQAQLRPPIERLQQALNGDLRGAGKLAGDPQALLLNDENELRGKLALLSDLASAKQRNAPELATRYTPLLAAMADQLLQTVFSRERLFQHTGDERALVAAIDAMKQQHSALAALPSLQVFVQREKSEFDLSGDDAASAERSEELRREIGSILHRYLDDVTRTQHLLQNADSARANVRAQVHGLLELLTQREADIAAHETGIRQRVRIALFALIALVLAVSGGLFWLQYRLSGVAHAVGAFQKQLAAGDLRGGLQLRSRIREIDELGRSTQVLQQALIDLNAELNDRSTQVAAASVRVLDSTRQLQDSLAAQLQHSTRASSAVAEMAAASRSVSSEVAEVVAATQRADRTLNEGTAIIERSVAGMSTLAGEITATVSALTQLQQHAAGIQSFVGNIQSIADQTNLLALNAAIEAARAGEQGRGFAVVADEVRTLAQRSSAATIEIERLIEKVGTAAQTLATVMHRQTASAQHTAEEIRAAGEAYRALEAGVSRIRNAIDDIAALSQQQDSAAQSVHAFIDSTVDAGAHSKQRSEESVVISLELDRIAGQVGALARQFSI